MPNYILVDVQTRKVILINALVCVFVFVIGIIIGYYSGKDSGNSEESTSLGHLSECTSINAIHSGLARERFKSFYTERHKPICVNDPSECWNLGLPRHYIAYHLNGQTINIDGKLSDPAWDEVPWSELFVDIRSEFYPKPYLDTKFKMRWDDERLYVGAFIQETDLLATYDTHDSQIFQENGFEMLLDVDGSMFNYKQVQINVIGTMMDQMFFKSPWDAPGVQVKLREWHAGATNAVYYEGTINKDNDVDKYWSVEISIPFKQLAYNSTRVNYTPDTDEVWFTQFGRSQQQIHWWAWQTCGAINLQLQDRWGLVQFKRIPDDKKFRFKNWHIYKALFDMRDAMVKYQAINGKHTEEIEELDIQPYLLSRACVEVPEIKVSKRQEKQPDGSLKRISDFTVTVQSMFDPRLRASIRSDRYVRFL